MNKNFFIENRKKIAELLLDNSVLILFSLPSDNLKFIIDKNFYYATGCDEVNDIFILIKSNGKVTERIYISKYDELYAKWNGRTYSKEEVIEKTGIESVFFLDSFKSSLGNILGQVENVYFDFSRQKYEECLSYSEVFANELKSKIPYINIKNARSIFAKVRTVKDSNEVDKVVKAIKITNEGIKAILKNLKPQMYEYQIESYFDQAIKYNGASNFAFTTIAASGVNATCLHYSTNNSLMNDGDLILVDLGAAFEGYHADISRTFPVNGKFSERQKQIYNIVLEGQKVAMNFTKPGVTTKEINNELIKYYQRALKEIGLIKNDSVVSKYYYHGVSHHLGLDTHDLCEYTPLVSGCIITCEPGLYIEEEKIGIRIEDDLLVTETGCINLSKDIIKTVEDIEEFMKE